MDAFLREFRGASDVEVLWLQEVYAFTQKNLLPVAELAGSDAGRLLASGLVRLVKALLGEGAVLPVSYRLVSLSHLLSLQRSPCCSHLTWSSSRYKSWASEGEQELAVNHKALPRANLILIGRLTDRGPEEQVHDGSLFVRDASGALHCELVKPDLDWLGKLLLFPSWNYIPQSAVRPGQEAGGYLEISEAPVPLYTAPAPPTPGEPQDQPRLSAERARELLLVRRCSRGLRLSVYGEVAHLCPLLTIKEKTFFYCLLRFSESEAAVPVLVMGRGKLCWHRFLQQGALYLFSALRVCILGVTGHRVLCVTPQSSLTSLPCAPQSSGEQERLQEILRESRGRRERREETERQRREEGEGEEEERRDRNRKKSKVIPYKGVITRVLNMTAGLFELDGRLGLCLAYQQVLNGGRGLRPGARIELHDAHLLFVRNTVPGLPPMMLCCCLRGSLAVLEFSRLGSGFEPFPWLGNLYCRALMEGQLEVGEYLWGCAAVETLTRRFCPRLVSLSRMAFSVAGRFLSSVLVTEETGRRHKRDIYREMLEEPHCCPLVEYSLLAPSWRTPTISELSSLIETQGWGALSLSSLLPASEIQHLTGPEINTRLTWSVYCQRVEQLEPPVIVLGLLRGSCGSACVQLADQTGSLDCVLVETEPNTGHTWAGMHTAWAGCLVRLQTCSVIMERFLRTEFPSWKELEDSQFIRERSCRVYVQFSLDNVQILSQSSAMAALQSRESEGVGRGREEQEQEQEGTAPHCQPEASGPSVKETAPEPETDREIPDSSVQDSWQEISLKSPPRKKPAGETGLGNSVRKGKAVGLQAWVSVLLRLTEKEGLMFRNAHPINLVPENQAGNRTGLGLGFGATASLAGGPQVWSTDPRNRPLREEEQGGESNSAPLRAELQFVGDSVRWFALIHPGRLYRLVAPNTADPNVFGQLSSPPAVLPVGAPQGSQCPLFLPVHPDWQLQCVEPHPREESWRQDLQPLRSVRDALSLPPPPSSSLLSFSGLILNRVTLDEGKRKTVIIQSQGSKPGVTLDCGLSVQLSVCDADRHSQCLKVYIDFTQVPYIPGLLPGARVNFHRLESKLSRQGKVYCRYTALSCLTVVGLGGDDSHSPNLDPPPPLVDLGDWASNSVHSILGRVRCHVSSVLLVDLQWTCSQCASVFKQDRCTRIHPPCSSENGVFQARAKFVVDDGSGFAHVVCRNRDVSTLLRLGGAEWEELQREVGVRGHVKYDRRGTSDEDGGWEQCEDSVLLSLSTLCCSAVVCSPVQITCRLSPGSLTLQQRLEKAQLKRFTIDDFEFLTWVPPPLQLNCEELTRRH
ncbi:LOW QUALITY PROTEIN: CST complex subunit CTC1 [Polyodon spathula]|uniref:LOW QUALITY PROTEIN: CST complex subunit CTC1 n=1 Tax=Polyodon spathula TaxID=7913 RepID=UPI001B7EBAB0|nr:LOW QUALITY PROTEIN: CST complex subunit CTC1 [Polyodon spathula]